MLVYILNLNDARSMILYAVCRFSELSASLAVGSFTCQWGRDLPARRGHIGKNIFDLGRELTCAVAFMAGLAVAKPKKHRFETHHYN